VSEVRAAALGDITPGAPHPVLADDRPLVLVRVGERVYALAGSCTHQGGPLAEGRLSATRLTCPWHGWSFDVRTGQCLFPQRGAAVSSYPVRVDGDDVWVDLPASGGPGAAALSASPSGEP
jgi:nitrite reductase (NADH) small subunit/3-phenylpropionate/trans-cinnamate dioxygenase ferredoxin subunit